MNRAEKVADLTKDLWDGTADLVTKVLDSSRPPSGWRVPRAALAAAAVDRIWMTPEQFKDWLLAQEFLAKKRKDPVKPVLALEIKAQKMDYLRGKRPISKMHALAMAHYAAGLPMPIEPEDTVAFDHWFTENFGITTGAGEFLDVGQSYIGDRVRGYDITRKGRAERLAGPALIRALDWILRMGPFCPYGAPEPIRPWPTEESSQ